MSSQLRPNPPKRRGFWVPAIVIAVLAAGALWWWQGKRSGSDEGAFRTVQIEQGDIRVAISATGTLSAISTVTVGSQISGQVTEVLVDFNSPVKKGDVLARIDPSTYRAQIAQGDAAIASAQAVLRQAEANLRNVRADFSRKNELGAQQLVSRSDVDSARASLEQAEAQVNVARAQIRQQTANTQTTRLNLERTVIRSPVDGVVLMRKIEPGQTVAASLQAPELFTIAEDLSKMKIELGVDESDIGQVKAGQGVSFTVDAFPNRQFRGVVEQVRLAATTSNNVVTYPVVVTVDNSDGTLLPGLTVNAEIEVSKREGVLKVANAALRYKPSEATQALLGEAAANGASGNARRGMSEELPKIAAGLRLQPAQQQVFDEALAAMRAAQAERQGATRSGNGSAGGPPMMMRSGSAPDPAMMAQIRARMRERMQRQFAQFRSTLDDEQRAQWDSAMDALLNANRAPLYLLVDGRPRRVMARIGASDGSSTEISGDFQAGDAVISGERAASSAK
ncbi:efflux transporter periplasmic adaptor subunit [Lysobacteraceae bacterium NML03-0222]|nr:efflux transporter periplasmic adaptor subunit [Xanthomonadaceae bacterium NML03-0222]